MCVQIWDLSYVSQFHFNITLAICVIAQFSNPSENYKAGVKRNKGQSKLIRGKIQVRVALRSEAT
jgi:hypothetical protein